MKISIMYNFQLSVFPDTNQGALPQALKYESRPGAAFCRRCGNRNGSLARKAGNGQASRRRPFAGDDVAGVR